VTRYLLDTNVVSSAASKRPDPAIVIRLQEAGPECAIAAPVWHELTFGCHRLPQGKRRTELEAYLEQVVRPAFPILPYDEAAATLHGQERARLEASGRPTSFVDGQIAAIASLHNLILVTTNVAHFSPFRELRVEDWSRPKRPGARS
jgi:tRNA(fMet)-specific endonuclease VapC